MSTTEEHRHVKVGLVLGGGGVLGAAWLIGALAALVDQTGWDPADAEIVVGTSAGAIVGSLAAAGARPWTAFDPGRESFVRDLLDGAAYRPVRPAQLTRPGSWSLAQAAWRAGARKALPKVLVGLAPQGVVSSEPIKALVRNSIPTGWPTKPRLWLVATDYQTGERVTFGAPRAPAADLAEAVSASCAVPGFYHPVEIQGRRYVDGGVNSAANLDLVAPLGLDLVLCFNPLSTPAPRGTGGPLTRVRARLHRQLMPQAGAVEERGTRVVVIEPSGIAVRLMGFNPMRRRRSAAVAEAAFHTVTEQLQQPGTRRLLTVLDSPDAARKQNPSIQDPPVDAFI